MNISMWLDNLAAFSLQVAILVAAGSLLVFAFRLRLPSVTLVFWQVLLVACLLLPFVQPWRRPVVSPPAPVPFVDIPFENPVVSPIVERSSYSPREVIAVALAAGAALRLLWLGLGLLRLSLYRHRAHWVSLLPSTVREMQDRIGVRPDIYLSPEIDSPVTFGLNRPVVLFPSTFPDLDEKFQAPIACHELLHVRRCDWGWMVLEEVVRSLFWFHPAFWWVLNRIHLSREQVVDSQVLKMTGERQPYLESLLQLAEMRGRPASVPAPLLLREHHLVDRVALMLKEAHMPKSRLIFSLALIAGLLFWAGSSAANMFPLSGSPVIVQTAQPGPLPEPEAALTAEDNINKALPQAESSAAEARKVEEIVPAAPEVVPQEPPYPRQVQKSKREPIRVGGNVQETKLIMRVDPEYPEAAKQARISGSVMMQVTVNEEGSVEDVKVLRGHPLLSDAAVSAVRQWLYSPTLLNGEAVPVIATATVIFSASGKSTTAAPEFVPQEPLYPRKVQERNRAPIRVGGNVQETKLIMRVDPEYPEAAKKARIAGTIIMQVTVSEDGSVEEVNVLRGHPLLNDAAVSAVKQWRYSPTLLNDEAVPVMATVTVIFGAGGNSTTVELDAQGNAREVGTGLEGSTLQAKMKEGIVSIRAGADVPYRTLERFLLSLQRDGISPSTLQGSIQHVIRDGRVFLAPSAEVRAPQLALDTERLAVLAGTAGAAENWDVSPDGKRRLRYYLFVDESGRVTSIQRIQGPMIAAVEEELLRTLVVAPGYRGSEPVPTMAFVEITPK